MSRDATHTPWGNWLRMLARRFRRPELRAACMQKAAEIDAHLAEYRELEAECIRLRRFLKWFVQPVDYDNPVVVRALLEHAQQSAQGFLKNN